METGGLFYTDANGRQTMNRKRNLHNLTELVPGNYYPVNTKIAVRDLHNSMEAAIITDRSHGGTSMNDGEMELMVSVLHFIEDIE